MTNETCATCRLWRSSNFRTGGCYRMPVHESLALRGPVLGRLFAVPVTGDAQSCPLWEQDDGAMPRFGFVKTKGAVVTMLGPDMKQRSGEDFDKLPF